LVSQLRDLSGEREGAIYEISPIGSRVLEAVREVQDLLTERSDESREAVVHSVRSAAFDTTVQITRGAEVQTEIGSYSEGFEDDTVTVRA
jgi:DNA-binding PadR family transcriptional regulator